MTSFATAPPPGQHWGHRPCPACAAPRLDLLVSEHAFFDRGSLALCERCPRCRYQSPTVEVPFTRSCLPADYRCYVCGTPLFSDQVVFAFAHDFCRDCHEFARVAAVPPEALRRLLQPALGGAA